MSRAFVAEYDASENVLRLSEPLSGVKDHEIVRVSIEIDSRPSLIADPLARLAALNAPTADIDQMLAETAAGRL
jgi:propanediol utilization protein